MTQCDDDNLPAPPLRLRLHVGLLATMVPLLVRVAPLSRLIRLLTPPAWLRPYRNADECQIVAAVRRRLASPKNMRRRACLREGLVLYHFLRLAGEPAAIHVGVYPPSSDPGRMHAHCWVTLNGRAVSDPPKEAAATMLSHGGDDKSSDSDT